MEPGALRQLENDLRAAEQVGHAMSSVPTALGPFWDVGVHDWPARLISGDFFDLSPSTEGVRVAVTMGDVAGKGLAAGLVRAGLHAVMKTLSSLRLAPAELLERANRELIGFNEAARLASVFYGELDAAGSGLIYASGGHLPPLLRRASGGWDALSPTGSVLGMFAGARFGERRVPLLPGDLLILYTDGAVEAEDAAGDFFGEERLRNVVERGADDSAGAIALRVAAELSAFAPGEPADDRTLVVLRRTEVHR
jgi:sigma-B regulation protein RsbU (phosphoserine phosphatase)